MTGWGIPCIWTGYGAGADGTDDCACEIWGGGGLAGGTFPDAPKKQITHERFINIFILILPEWWVGIVGCWNPAAWRELSAVKSFNNSSFSVLRAKKIFFNQSFITQLYFLLTKTKIRDFILKHNQKLCKIRVEFRSFL